MQLPATLPDGAHRVIKELTAAKMRAMMQGIVVEGTGKQAQLNGYSSAGKTGTAEKIDPATHTYSHTKLVASFAGFAPVSDPAIAVAVVIDTPTVGEACYGGAVSAPVFARGGAAGAGVSGRAARPAAEDASSRCRSWRRRMDAGRCAGRGCRRSECDVRRGEQPAGGRSAAAAGERGGDGGESQRGRGVR